MELLGRGACIWSTLPRDARLSRIGCACLYPHHSGPSPARSRARHHLAVLGGSLVFFPVYGPRGSQGQCWVHLDPGPLERLEKDPEGPQGRALERQRGHLWQGQWLVKVGLAYLGPAPPAPPAPPLRLCQPPSAPPAFPGLGGFIQTYSVSLLSDQLWGSRGTELGIVSLSGT